MRRLICAFLAGLGLTLSAGESVRRPIEEMAAAAQDFLKSLNADQRARTVFAFPDEERANWHFVPRDRRGLPWKEMTPAQRPLARALLASGLSAEGLRKATNIMALETILHDLEGAARRFPRDPELYYVSIFGEPGAKTTWGWRVEGHHLSVNFTLANGQVISGTPSFLGSNPAEVRQGPRQGLRILAAEEDLGRQLVTALTDEQRRTAIIAAKAPPEILTGNARKAQVLEPIGLLAAQMTQEQNDLLLRLVKEYVFRHRPELADQDLAKIQRAGWDKVRFAWAGGVRKGEAHYYRVQGPSFLLEYDNTQNDANHIHAVWRDFENDFGVDLLRRHYEVDPHR